MVGYLLFYSMFSITKKYNISGEYTNATEYSIISISLYMVGDSLVGNHTFITNNGNRIDFCADTENTLHLSKIKNNIFEGTLTSCYTDVELYNVRIEQIDEITIQFSFINNNHAFLQKSFKLKKSEL